MDPYLYNLLLAVFVYILGSLSPGPANLVIAHIAVHSGRVSACMFALGVITAAFLWAMSIASGLGSILDTHPNFLYGLKICSGLYFLYFGMVLLRKAFFMNGLVAKKRTNYGKNSLFVSGLFLHLVNPKAFAVWTAITAMGLPVGASGLQLYLPAILCFPFTLTVFLGYALFFSTQKMVQQYLRYKKAIDIVAGVAFFVVGCRFLYLSTSAMFA